VLRRALWILAPFVVEIAALAQTGGQTEFVPYTGPTPAEQLPAAPLVIAAYAFVWVALMWYLWSIWRRLGKVEADLQTLERRRTRGSGR
jgi:CcmD family protein